ncbi:MAG: Abi family protein, partial [Oscillospiraceae bacterium]|nr:Abi family protein [Oscillospiraceae bacterium]
MNNQYNKPKLTAIQLVSMMSKEKGITFKHMTRAQAVIFLEERNNFFRLASYRKNYDKQQSGAYVNKHYINLDFAYLVELSTLDMYLRNIIMQMCIDVEHCLKVNLLTDLSKNSSENGYSLVNEFLNAKSNNYIVKSVIKKSNSKYSGDLICKYFTYQYTPKNDSSNPNAYVFDCPAWVLVDTISFGDF